MFMIPTFYHKEDQYTIYKNSSQIFPVQFPRDITISDTLT